jgi:hypothetical protein
MMSLGVSQVHEPFEVEALVASTALMARGASWHSYQSARAPPGKPANLGHRDTRFLLFRDADYLRLIEPLLLHRLSSFEILEANLTLKTR